MKEEKTKQNKTKWNDDGLDKFLKWASAIQPPFGALLTGHCSVVSFSSSFKDSKIKKKRIKNKPQTIPIYKRNENKRGKRREKETEIRHEKK